MRRTDLLKMSACAAGSFAMSIALWSPPRLDATAPSTQASTSVIDAARLSVGDLDLSVRYNGVSTSEKPMIMLEPGTELNIALLASNNNDRAAASVPVTISISGTDNTSPMSRVIRYKELWRHDEVIALAPGKALTLDLPTNITVANGQSFFVSVTSGKQSVTALRLAATFKLAPVSTSDAVAASKTASGS